MKKINNPFPKTIKKNKVYFWCACGKSANQPFCDRSHKKTKKHLLNLIVKNLKKYFFVAVRKAKTNHFVMVLINH